MVFTDDIFTEDPHANRKAEAEAAVNRAIELIRNFTSHFTRCVGQPAQENRAHQ